MAECKCGAKMHQRAKQCRECYREACAASEAERIAVQCRCPSCGGFKKAESKTCAACLKRQPLDAIEGSVLLSMTSKTVKLRCECGREFCRDRGWVARVNSSWGKVGTRHVCAKCQRKKIREVNSSLFPKTILPKDQT